MHNHYQLAFGIHTAHTLPIAAIIPVHAVVRRLDAERHATRKSQFDVFRESLRYDIRDKTGFKPCAHMNHDAPWSECGSEYCPQLPDILVPMAGRLRC